MFCLCCIKVLDTKLPLVYEKSDQGHYEVHIIELSPLIIYELMIQ